MYMRTVFACTQVTNIVMDTVRRIDKFVGLFCKRALYKRQYSAKETCYYMDATDGSHPIKSQTL